MLSRLVLNISSIPIQISNRLNLLFERRSGSISQLPQNHPDPHSNEQHSEVVNSLLKLSQKVIHDRASGGDAHFGACGLPGRPGQCTGRPPQ
jgi:hypothetical protein